MIFQKESLPITTANTASNNSYNGYDGYRNKNKQTATLSIPPDGNLFNKEWSSLKLFHHQKYLSHDKLNSIKYYCQTIVANCFYSNHIKAAKIDQ